MHPSRTSLPVLVALAAALAACGKKEEAPPPTTLPLGTVATTTTTTTTTTTMPSPPPAWKAARWGMSRADVLTAFPGQAQRLSPTVDFGPPKAGPADLGILSYPGDGGLAYRVLFGFAGEKLDRIQLSALKPGSGACEDVDKAVSDAHAGVRPARDSNQTNVKTDTTSWKGAEAAITLTCTENRVLNFRTLVLEYTPPAP